MSTQLDHENEAFLWETLDQAWANLSENSSDDEVAGRKHEAEGSEKGKKRVRGIAQKGKEKKEEEGTSDHDMHIWTERERRKKMRNMFSNLHALIPHLPPKADKSSIVDEAVNYIKSLQSTLQRLQKQKLERVHGGAGGATNPNSLSSCDHPSIGATSWLAMASSSREAFMADQVSSLNNNNGTSSSNNSAMTRTNTVAFHLPVFIQTWTSSNVVLNICGNDAHFSVYAPKKPGLLTSICAALEKHKMEVVSAHVSSDAYRRNYMIQARLAKRVSDELSEMTTVEERFKQAGGEIMMWVSS
ncbi:hypothetical protein Cgig2_014849 [Carnegiea gigantea]|uniref:BHLH domain-containing protein n=1 Tax=Carnegiea gigantea TaxID=171969 RepID=A0A9Q1KYD0_9CARY|nr:hypothetical protein Cgig2_014849 [Carnegiea gigantea]